MKRFLVLAAFLGLAACGGGDPEGLQIEGAKIAQPPSLADLKDGLKGAADHPPYVANPLDAGASS